METLWNSPKTTLPSEGQCPRTMGSERIIIHNAGRASLIYGRCVVHGRPYFEVFMRGVILTLMPETRLPPSLTPGLIPISEFFRTVLEDACRLASYTKVKGPEPPIINCNGGTYGGTAAIRIQNSRCIVGRCWCILDPMSFLSQLPVDAHYYHQMRNSLYEATVGKMVLNPRFEYFKLLEIPFRAMLHSVIDSSKESC